MDPHRRYAAILFAAFITTNSFASNVNQADVIAWTQIAVSQLSAKQNIDDKWRKITPKYTQQGHDAAKSLVWIVRLVDPTAKFVTEQNLYLILNTCGELIAFSHQLPAQYLITQY
jgi:hypothetical protein